MNCDDLSIFSKDSRELEVSSIIGNCRFLGARRSKTPLRFNDVLAANFVLGRNQATWIVLSRYVTKPYIVRQAPEERNAIAYQHWNTRDNEALNEAGSEKALNSYPAIHVYMPYATSFKLRNDFNRITGQTLNYRTSRDGRE